MRCGRYLGPFAKQGGTAKWHQCRTISNLHVHATTSDEACVETWVEVPTRLCPWDSPRLARPECSHVFRMTGAVRPLIGCLAE